MPIQGNMFNPRQSYAKPSAKTQFMRQQMGSLFYPQGRQQPNLQTAPQRSMLPNPIAPAAADARANAQFMQANPGFGTSFLDATQRFGGMTANNAFQSSMVNGYVGQANPMVPFNEAASRARNMEQVQRGVLPAERGGSYGRFTDGGTPWQEQYFNNQREQRQAADHATSQSAMAQRLQTQMPTDRAQNVFTKRQADGSLAYTDRLQALQNMDPNTPGLADAISLEEGKREAATQRMSQRLQDYKDKNAGMSPRQVRRERLQTQREDNRMRKAVMRGMNPMSPQATAMFPEASARFQQNMQKQKSGGVAMQNPMLDAFKPDAPTTPENRAARASVRSTLVNGDQATGAPPSPTLSAFGVRDDMTPDQFRWAIVGGLESGDASLEGIQDIFNFVKTYDAGEDGGNPFAFAPGLDTLWSLPADAKPEELSKWYREYRASLAQSPRWSPEGGI